MNRRARLNGWSLGVGIVIGLGFGFGLAHRHHLGPPHDPFHGKDLTDDEKKQVHEIAKAAMEQDRPLLTELDEKTHQLRENLDDVKTTNDDLAREFTVVNDLRHKLAERRFELHLKVRQAIGPERIGRFDPIGPPPSPPGLHGPHGHHGPPGPPPDGGENFRDER